MARNDDVRFISSAVKLPPFTPPVHRHSLFSSARSKFATLPFNFNPDSHLIDFISSFLNKQSRNAKKNWSVFKKPPLFCSAALALSEQSRSGDDSGTLAQPKNVGSSRAAEEERVLNLLISEVLVRNKDGEELERKDLESEALNALKASRANSALTVREVQEDVHRIIASGYFMSCMPFAVDTRDGIRLIFQVEPNQEFQGLVCEGANVLPAKFIEDAFRDGYGKVVNVRRLDEVVNSIDSWYMERGLFGMVSGVEILSGGIIKLQASEAEVNDISIRYLDKTGEPTVGKTRPDTILRQLTTKKGQVYSMIQGKRDVDTLLAMGVMDDVSIIPQPAGETGKVDLTMNVVERKSGGGISGGDGISSSIAIYHKNLFGQNQKINLSLLRGSRAIMIQNSRTPGTLVHGNQPDNNGLIIGRVTAGIEYSRSFTSKWYGTAGLVYQRASARDEQGNPITRDFFGSPLTASGNPHDNMLLAKLETVYTGSGDPGSSMCVLNMDQGIHLSADWLVVKRVNARARQGFAVGPAKFLFGLSGGRVVGKFPPHEAFPIGGTNSVRGYEEGAVGSGCSYAVGSGEISFPLMGPVEGAVFADYGTDLGSGQTVPGDPAGARNKPGSGYGYGVGVRVDSPLGLLRLEYAFNDQRAGRFHFGVGLRN